MTYGLHHLFIVGVLSGVVCFVLGSMHARALRKGRKP